MKTLDYISFLVSIQDTKMLWSMVLYPMMAYLKAKFVWEMMSISLSQRRNISEMLLKTSTRLSMRVEMCITLMLMVQGVEGMKTQRGGWTRLKGKRNLFQF